MPTPRFTLQSLATEGVNDGAHATATRGLWWDTEPAPEPVQPTDGLDAARKLFWSQPYEPEYVPPVKRDKETGLFVSQRKKEDPSAPLNRGKITGRFEKSDRQADLFRENSYSLSSLE
jgi:hypothetical protein